MSESRIGRYVGQCFYCGTVLVAVGNSPNRRTTDHLVPKSRGGDVGVHNLRDACKLCNNDKGHLDVEEYRLVMAYRRGILRGTDVPSLMRKFRFWGESK